MAAAAASPSRSAPRAFTAALRWARTTAALDRGVRRAFRWAVDGAVTLLLPCAMLALVMGFARIVVDLGAVWRSPTVAAAFDLLVTDILSMFVVVELLKSIAEYFEAHRLKLTFIVDGAIVFVLREAMIGLYEHNASAAQLAALAALLLVCGVLRVVAVVWSPEASRT